MNKVLFAFLLFSSLASATDINLTWLAPEYREDGTAITGLDGYTIYHTINNGVQDNIKVDASATSFQILNVEKGIHTFMISATEMGFEGEKSNPISEPIDISKIGKILITVEVIE